MDGRILKDIHSAASSTLHFHFLGKEAIPVQYSYISPGAETVPAARAAGPRSAPQGSEAAVEGIQSLTSGRSSISKH